MSETLQGVLIGGFIGLLMPLITLRSTNSKWEKEKQLERLKQKKEHYKAAFDKAADKLAEFIETRMMSTDVLDFDISFPKEVSKAFKIMIEDDDKSPEKTRGNYWLLIASMKKYLKSLDDEIDKIIKK